MIRFLSAIALVAVTLSGPVAAADVSRSQISWATKAIPGVWAFEDDSGLVRVGADDAGNFTATIGDQVLTLNKPDAVAGQSATFTSLMRQVVTFKVEDKRMYMQVGDSFGGWMMRLRSLTRADLANIQCLESGVVDTVEIEGEHFYCSEV